MSPCHHLRLFLKKLRLAALTLASILLLTGLLGLIFIKDLLLIASDIWVVDHPVAQADAAYVLGGGLQTRPFTAARLYRRGMVPKILVANVELRPSDLIGITVPESKLTTRILRELGVPDSDIVLIGTNVSSTFEEAEAIRDWSRENKAATVIVPTDTFHTRRAHWIINRVAGSNSLTIHTLAIPDKDYTIENWWAEEEGLVFFQNEIVKYLLYRVKY